MPETKNESSDITTRKLLEEIRDLEKESNDAFAAFLQADKEHKEEYKKFIAQHQAFQKKIKWFVIAMIAVSLLLLFLPTN